ncbi:DNA repair protein RadC [Candidatus Uabimicrobium sp. HlEnr_7]|uniref:RadC family protein n=1 Tax=Candidatus Uabimicrobium helgolandensis TaxID=3095367 RepID=UPI0035577A04
MKNFLRSLSPNEKPREKVVAHGISILSDRELFALIFRSGTRNHDVLDVSRKMLEEFPSLRVLSTASIAELQKLPGIGLTKAIQVQACLEIARRFCQKVAETGEVLSSSKQVYQHFQCMLRDEKKEKFFCVHLGSKNQVLKKELISIGSLNASIVHPREVFSSAIKESSNSLLLVHNHPSGDPTPSKEDISTTKRLIEVGSIVGIKIIDHIIIGEGCYVSFAEQNIVHF